MAGEDPAGEPEAAAARRSTLRERLGVDHRHDRSTVALVVGFAVVLGWYAGWLTADLGLRAVAFVGVGLVAGLALYRRRSRRRVAVVGLYALAAMVALTPVALDATLLLDGDLADPWPFVFTTATLVYLAVFALLAAIPAGLGYLLDRRGR